MLGLNRNQWLGIAIIVVSVLSVSSANLIDIFGAGAAKKIVSSCAILSGIFGGIVTVITGQSGMISQIGNLKGVEPIQINKDAEPALAKLAVNPDLENVMPKPGQDAAVQRVADQKA